MKYNWSNAVAIVSLVLFLIIIISTPFEVLYGQLPSLPESERDGRLGPNNVITDEYIITLKNASSQIDPLTHIISNITSNISTSAEYLEQKEQIVLNKYEDGLAVRIPPNLTTSAAASSIARNGELNNTTLIDILSIYSPEAKPSDVLSTAALNDTIKEEGSLDVGLTTSYSIPAQNVTLLGTTSINDSTVNLLTTPVLNPIIESTEKKDQSFVSVMSMNVTVDKTIDKKADDIDGIITNTSNKMVSIPAQNVTLLGTTNINESTAALLSLTQQNISVITTTADNKTAENEFSVPSQNITILASQEATQLADNSTEICDVVESNPAVESCIPNIAGSVSSLITDWNFNQFIPTSLKRINGDNLDSQAIAKENITMVIMDSGVNYDEDLNLKGNFSCMGEPDYNYTGDDINHGTLVAGIAGAKNNSLGIVGVVPGINIFSLKVLGKDEAGMTIGGLAEYKCALEYIKNNAAWIDVVNISVKLDKLNLQNPRLVTAMNVLRDLVKESVMKNVTFVGAAGNDLKDAGLLWPGLDDNIIIVGAMTDSDGLCGGLGPEIPVWDNDTGFIIVGSTLKERDDSFASSYSNVGESVDIVAPGTNIVSISNNGSLQVDSGTSYASPYIAGAAAIYKGHNPDSVPWLIRSALFNLGWTSGDANCYYTVNNTLVEPQVPLLNVEEM